MQRHVLHRIEQVWQHLRPGARAMVPPDLDAMLTPGAANRFQQLSAADQMHAMTVATTLQQHGASLEVVTAGLLHDIGKIVPDVTVRMTDRIGKVLLERLWSRGLQSLAGRATPPRRGAGLWVLARHAEAGAELARVWGYSPRTCWLIAHHDDKKTTDPDLALLINADSGRIDHTPVRMAAHG